MPEKNDSTIAVKIKLELNEGEIKSPKNKKKSKELDKLNKGMKDLKNIFGKVKDGGIFSQMLTGGGLWAGIKALGTFGLALAGLAISSTIKGSTSPGEQADMYAQLSGESYEPLISAEGERLVALTDAKTGKIKEILTIREARERGIVDELGNIKENLNQWNSEFDKLIADNEQIGGSLFVQNKDLTEINKIILLQGTNKQIIIELKKKKKALLEAKLRAMESKRKYSSVDQLKADAGAITAIQENEVLLNNYLIGSDEMANAIFESQGGTPEGVSQFDMSLLE